MKLIGYFEKLCTNINPSPTYVQAAAREHRELRRILENDLEVSKYCPDTFLHGSYAMKTAIKQML